jgi:hypothetical protein
MAGVVAGLPRAVARPGRLVATAATGAVVLVAALASSVTPAQAQEAPVIEPQVPVIEPQVPVIEPQVPVIEPQVPVIEPQVVVTIDTSAAGGGARPLIGDVTGDGRFDIVMMQPHFIVNDAFEGALVAALTAYDIEGNLLWQAGTVDPRGRNQGSDIPAQIYDVDGDGDNEVVAIMHPGGDTSLPGTFRIFDGRTGELVREFALPHREAHDAILFVNLSGSDTAREILLKDRYNRVWAIDSFGNLLWTRPGNTGHYPWPYDFNGDGRQEIMIGYDLVSLDGETIWQYNGTGHADTMWMADMTGDGIPEIMLGGDAAIAFDASDGSQLWRQEDIVETQNIMTADFVPSLPGLESLGLDRIDRSSQGYDGLFLLDHNGQFVWKEERQTRGCWGSIPEPIHNWTGDYSDLIMVWNRGCGEPTTIMNGSGDVISVLDSRARLWHADFCGDDKEEVLEYIQGVSVTIKSNGPCDIDAKVTGIPSPQPKRLFNYTRYTAGDSPVDLAAGRPTSASSARDGYGSERAHDGDAATAWQAGVRSPGQWWQVDLGRWYRLTGITLSLPAPGVFDACTSTITGAHNGPLTVTSGVTCLDGATVRGAIAVRPGTALVAANASIFGPVSAVNPAGVRLQDSTIRGSVSIRGTTGRVHLTGNQIDGPIFLTGSDTGATPVVVSGNTINGALACSGNTPAPAHLGSANTVNGPASGQCADIPAAMPIRMSPPTPSATPSRSPRTERTGSPCSTATSTSCPRRTSRPCSRGSGSMCG